MTDPSGSQIFDVELKACRPEPLASYLKALGVFRIVAEQKDHDAKGFWRGQSFVLRSTLDSDALLQFFLREWRPTPVISPWNGGSGFFPKDNQEARDAIVASTDPRLVAFAASIEIACAFLQKQGWTERPQEEAKQFLISAMRAQLPDEALAWLDAAVVLGSDRVLFPPLLGTGGNDGRLEFSNNYQQRVLQVLGQHMRVPLASSLFGDVVTTRFKGTMGQYLPAASERTNPWDFVLLIEGALMFAAAATRRYENASRSVLAFPFHARAAGGMSNVTEIDESASRDELWLPLWSSPSTNREMARLFAEGRATVGNGETARPAASALDFARAITSLGVDRGINAFSRVGFHVRNGLSYFATPLGQFATGNVQSVRLLDDIDAWFEQFRQKAVGKNVPARVSTAFRRLEQCMFDAVTTGNLGPVLIELGACELAISRSLEFAERAFLAPVPALQSSWAVAVDGGSIEQRLAAALASRAGIRRRMIPLDRSGRHFGRGDDVSVVFAERPLVANLHALLLREDIEERKAEARPAVDADARCSLGDIAEFIDGNTDDSLIERWLRGYVLIENRVLGARGRDDLRPPATFALLAIVHGRTIGAEEVPRTASMLSRACAGDAIGATTLAGRRIAAAGHVIPMRAILEPPKRMLRIAAALAFPLTSSQRRTLESMVLSTSEQTDSPTMTSQETT